MASGRHLSPCTTNMLLSMLRIDRTFIVKNSEKFSEHNKKISPEKSLPLPRNRKESEKISLSYDVNVH